MQRNCCCAASNKFKCKQVDAYNAEVLPSDLNTALVLLWTPFLPRPCPAAFFGSLGTFGTLAPHYDAAVEHVIMSCCRTVLHTLMNFTWTLPFTFTHSKLRVYLCQSTYPSNMEGRGLWAILQPVTRRRNSRQPSLSYCQQLRLVRFNSLSSQPMSLYS